MTRTSQICIFRVKTVALHTVHALHVRFTILQISQPSGGFRNYPESPSERRYFNLKVVAHKPLLAKMTPSRSPDTASVTFRTAKQKEEKDLFPYVSVPRFDTSLTVLNEKRSASILSIVWHDGFAARLQQECQFWRIMLSKSWLKNRQCHGRWLPNYMLIFFKLT